MSDEKKDWSGKRLLMLSGPMGTGHVQASRAIEKYAALRYPGLQITHLNSAELMTPGLKFLFTGFYHFVLRHFPWFWAFLYRRSNVPPESTPPFRKFLFLWRRVFENRLIKYVAEQNPDYLICTHFMPAEIVAKAKAQGKVTCLTASVVTDFSLHWVYIQNEIDLFFVANHDMSLMMHLRGIDREKIYITGCPIFPEFSRSYSSDDIVKLRDEFGLPRDAVFVMVMMGGENIGHISEITRGILQKFPTLSVMPMTGKDKSLFEEMSRLKDRYPGRVFPVAYTTRVSDYMSICHLVITKPGGITVSECLSMKKPMIIMDPIPGHEEKNALYLSTHGLAAFSESLADLALMDMEPGATWMQMVSSYHSMYNRGAAAANILKVVIEWEGSARPAVS
jgi:processive 1,2-diacylglycerol beta-glucosyltransferase